MKTGEIVNMKTEETVSMKTEERVGVMPPSMDTHPDDRWLGLSVSVVVDKDGIAAIHRGADREDHEWLVKCRREEGTLLSSAYQRGYWPLSLGNHPARIPGNADDKSPVQPTVSVIVYKDGGVSIWRGISLEDHDQLVKEHQKDGTLFSNAFSTGRMV